MEKDVSDPNEHVKDYLRYYLNINSAPRFAVLVSGKWGIGKTHLLREFLQAEKAKYLYVSLNGISDVAEIDRALVHAMYPILDTKLANIAGKLTSTILKSRGYENDFKPEDIIKISSDLVCVFDDLERCKLPIEQTLGYLNNFVEHDGRRVLLIADESSLHSAPEFRLSKEKLIGKTQEIQSVHSAAIESFFGKIENNAARDFLETQQDDILSVFSQSGTQNLRILQQSLWDFERTFIILDTDLTAQKGSMKQLLRFFLALSFEFKSGNITASDLNERPASIVSYMMERGGDDLGVFALADKKYENIELSSTLLSDDLLLDILSRGRVDSVAINTYLDGGDYFRGEEEEPAWKMLWYGFSRTQSEFDAALPVFEKQFEQREFCKIGELLHIFGLRLHFSKIGVLRCDVDSVVDECKRYVDEALKNDELQPTPFSGFLFGVNNGGFEGLQYHEHDSEEFKALFEYLRDACDAARDRSLSKIGQELLAVLNENPDAFYDQVVATSHGPGTYCRTPVLATINPIDFLDTICALSEEGKRIAFLALSSRYEHSQLERDLTGEKEWLSEFRGAARSRAEKDQSPMEKYKLLRRLEDSIDIHLNSSAD